MSQYAVKVLLWTCIACITAASLWTVNASATFDALPGIEQHAQQLTTSHLADALNVYTSVLVQHNKRKESPTLSQYVQQLQAVLQPGCCDYFTALPTVKGLTAALSEVLALWLPPVLRPVVRRSYVAAIWLLQRSKYFKWDSSTLHKSAVSGLNKLYEQHVEAVSGKPISFHHISKTGGTTLCGVAWENGCRGPDMSKKDNCLLDTGADGPVWVLHHNVTTANGLQSIPPPPPAAQPAAALSADQQERMRLAAVTHKLLSQHSYDWFMYECPADRLVGRVGRPCADRQEGAISKSATFFANENTLPTEHGTPQVCEAFANVVMLRDAVSEAVSLMSEVSLVYVRLLKQQRVLGWAPPTWDLSWWQQRAPAVVSSYATRTLLGPAALCPPVKASSPATTPADSSSSSNSGRVVLSSSSSSDTSSNASTRSPGDRPVLMPLSQDDIQRALQVLASFDAVLDLSSLDLINTSLAKLLGWSKQSYSAARHQRSAQRFDPPTWERLGLLARQQAPGQQELSSSSSGGGGGGAGGGSSVSYLAAGEQEGPGKDRRLLSGDPSHTQGYSMPKGVTGDGSSSTDAPEVDSIRRMMSEVRVREVYSRYGLQHVLLPVVAEVPLAAPHQEAVAAAVAALTAVRRAQLTMDTTTDVNGESHLLVRLLLDNQASNKPASAAKDAVPYVYHVWPRHGVVLGAAQYQLLQQDTAADALLYQHGRVMQLLDAAWVTMLAQQRKVRKMLVQVQGEVGEACGFAGLNHMQ